MDAVIKTVYRSRKADYVLKFDEKSKAMPVCCKWEHTLLRKEFVLVYERGLENDECFVLVFAPFSVLSDVAESREINFVIKQEEQLTPDLTWLQKLRNFFSFEDHVNPEPSANFRRDRLMQAGPASLTPAPPRPTGH